MIKNIYLQWRGEDINLLKYIDIYYTVMLKESHLIGWEIFTRYPS